jgi:hypothetical protein
MRRPAKSPVKGEKKSTPTGRKFTASTAAKRHSRPGLARRPSSQSSVETGSKGSSHGTASRPGAKSSSVEQSLTASLASSAASTVNNSPTVHATVADKRAARAGVDRTRHSDRGGASSAHSRTLPVIVQQRQEAVVVQGQSSEHRTSISLKNDGRGTEKHIAVGETPKPQLGVGSPGKRQVTAPVMARSQSNIEHQHHRPRDLHVGRTLPPSLITPKSTPVAKKAADVAVQVQFDSESVTAQGGGGALDRDLPDSVTIASRPSASSLYMPTQPSPTPAPFLGRSKSQLTLLLEKMDQGKSRSNRDTKERGY